MSIAHAEALAMKAELEKKGKWSVDFNVETYLCHSRSENVIATTTGGDGNNVVMLGAHSDTALGAPGINDNGSGTAALLEVAKQLSKFSVKNKVRFAWWTAEEIGLVGSTQYVEALTDKELMKIRMYLNHDMLASGNGILSAHDGGDGVHPTARAGSTEIEHMYQNYFSSKGINLVPSALNGRSDYGPFLYVGVPCGGLLAGGDDVLTQEQSQHFHDGKGKVGKPQDGTYHKYNDTLENINLPFLEVNSRAVAHSVGTYARSLNGFPARERGDEELTKQQKRYEKSKRQSTGYWPLIDDSSCGK